MEVEAVVARVVEAEVAYGGDACGAEAAAEWWWWTLGKQKQRA